MSEENLHELLAKRAPRNRSKLSTVLMAILILLVGVFVGVALGKGVAACPTGVKVATGVIALGVRVPGEGVFEIEATGALPARGSAKKVAGDLPTFNSDTTVEITSQQGITTVALPFRLS